MKLRDWRRTALRRWAASLRAAFSLSSSAMRSSALLCTTTMERQHGHGPGLWVAHPCDYSNRVCLAVRKSPHFSGSLCTAIAPSAQ